jgi:hypothetical protein
MVKLDLSQYANETDKFESLYTIMVHSISPDDLVVDMQHQLKKINTVTNTYRRKYLNDRMFSFIEHIKQNYSQVNEVNSLFLIGKEIHDIPLTKNYRNILKEYNVMKQIFLYGSYFAIDRIDKILNDTHLHDIILIDKDKFTHTKLNSTKYKVMKHDISVSDLVDYMNKNDIKRGVFHGAAIHIKKIIINSPHIKSDKKLTNEELLSLVNKYDMQELHRELTECIAMISNEKTMHLISYGKNLVSDIKNFMIKKLYCTSKMTKRVKDKFEKSELNFKMIEVTRLEKGDICDIFDKDYNGIIGIKYY